MAVGVDESFVRVFIWNSGLKQNIGLNSLVPSFGHVALETQLGGVSRYISFWPGCNTNLCNQKKSHYHEKQIDELYETRPADAIFVLKNLDISKINDWFENNKDNLIWCSQGSSAIKKSYEFNCVGLTFHLLQTGGMRNVSHYKTKNIKRISFAIFTSCSLVAVACSISYRIIKPFWRLHDKFGIWVSTSHKIYNSSLVALSALKIVYEQLRLAETALKTFYYEEIIGFFLDYLLKSKVSNLIQILDDPDRWWPPFESMPIPRDMVSIFPNMVQKYAHYRSFINLGGSICALTAIFGISTLSFNNKIVLETLTPKDLENLVSEEVEKEKKELDQKNFLRSDTQKKSFFSTIVLALVTFVFLKTLEVSR